MKQVFIFFAAFLLTASLWAQSPEKMSFQAVIRNNSDALVTNTQIGMEINIRQGSPAGTIVYTETQTPTTNASGLVSIEIGGGTGFNTIDWSAGPYFIETKTAIAPPLTSYTITGTSQLLSVPYALHAQTAETISGGITETDPVFTAWDKDYSDLINQPAIPTVPTNVGAYTNDAGYLTSFTETDPLWAASPSFGITNTNVSNWNSAFGWGNHATAGYLTSFTETDPLWSASPSFGITNTNVSNWNSAFGWGNHATAGYLTSFTETDPLWSASPSFGITNTNILNWNSAFGWGNHATVGYLTSFTETDPLWSASPSFGITNSNISNWNIAFGWGNHSGLYRPITWVPAWTEVTGKPTFATVATSGSYTDLSNKPANATTSVAGFMSGTDKAKLNGIATGAEVNVNADWNATSGDSQILNKPTIPAAANGSETKLTAGTNITITGIGTTASPYVVNATGTTTLTIGQSYQGGIIFWLDASGQHGLIAATADQGTVVPWYTGSYTTTNAVRDGIGAGMYNTERIIASQGAGSSYAAQLCANYQGGGYGDWYLPSKYELNLLYLQKTVVGGFSNMYYWSSTEYDINSAYEQIFSVGYQDHDHLKNFGNYVRAIRAF